MKKPSTTSSQVTDDVKTAIEELCEPDVLEGEIRLKLWKKKQAKSEQSHRTKKYYAVLAKGFLRLFTEREDKHYKYEIDLAKVPIKDEQGAIVFEFRTTGIECSHALVLHVLQKKTLTIQVESRVLIPVNVTDFSKWKEALQKHQSYRKAALRLSSMSPSMRSLDSDVSVKSALASASTASALREWDTMETCLTMMNDIQQMQGLSIEVLDRMSSLAIEMRKVAEELNEAALLIRKGGHRLDPVSRSNLSSSLCGVSAVSSIALAKPRLWFEDDETIEAPQSSVQYDTDFLEQDVRTKALPNFKVLHSLKATGNVSERKGKVIGQTLKCLGRKSLPPPPRRFTSASALSSDSVSAMLLRQLSQEKKISDGATQATPNQSSGIVQVGAGAEAKPVTSPGKTRKQHRRTLPAIQSPSEKISFAALGRMILQRTGVPITHYEPLTALQLLCDELRFSELLNTACSKEAAEEKMVYVAAFAASPYLNSTGRYRKFFNPLLGETYEYEQEDFKFHSEQVSHHPAVSAGHAIGNGWTWFQTFSAEITWNAWAQSCEFMPERLVRLQLTGDDYSWNKVTTHIENLMCIPEQRKLYHEGTIKVRCSNGASAYIEINKNKELFGEVMKPGGGRFCKLAGRWDENICSEMNDGKEEQLLVLSRWPLYPEYFGFSDFSMGLNELWPEQRESLPPTDSRLRPDVRQLEDGNLDKAVAYKQELEKAQRARAIDEEKHKPLWFTQKEDSFTNTKMFISTGKYWEAKDAKFEQQKKDNAFIPIFNVSITS